MRDRWVFFMASLLLFGACKATNADDSTSISKQIQLLNSQIQSQLQEIQETQQKQLQTMNSKIQNQIKKVQADLQQQIQQLNNDMQTNLKKMQANMPNKTA